VSTMVTVPCFSGAPWDARQLETFAGRNVLTMRLPERLDTVEANADFLTDRVRGLGDYVLVGDSYGAVIALTLAIRRPAGLSGLVLSGGFAANPLPAWKGMAASASRFADGPLYRQGTLRLHAYQLHSRFDTTAPVPHTQDDYRHLFIDNTPRDTYTARVTSVTHFDVRDQLGRVDVPTLLLTPEDDKLVGTQAAQEMLAGIPGATEIVLPHTGHMFRFTHPDQYGQAITAFIDQRAVTRAATT
jgi:pimeloyl-ACP methyl ester carboxylesterase